MLLKKQLTQLFLDSLVYGLAGIVSSFISIFLIPLYTRVFQPADYGIISIVSTTAALLSILLMFGLDNSAAVFFSDKQAYSERKKTFNSWLWFMAFASILFSLLVMSFSTSLSYLFFSTDKYSVLFMVMSINLSLAGFQKLTNIWCRMLQQPVKAMVFSTTILLVTVGFNVLFILYWKIGVIGVFYSQLIASVVGFLLMLAMFKNWISIEFFSAARLREMIHLSAPLIPAAILYWLMNMASVYFLKLYVKGNSEVGLFQVGASVANVLALCTWPFFQAWTPFGLLISREPNAPRSYSITFELYCVLGFFIAFALMLMSKDVLIIFTQPDYLPASAVVGLLAVNVIISGMPNIFGIANNLAKQNVPYAVAVGLGACVTVILFFVLIPPYGKVGTALAMIFGNLTVAIYTVIKAQKLYYIPYHFTRITLVVVTQLLLFVIAQQFVETPLLRILVVLSMAIVLGSVYYLTYVHFSTAVPFKKKKEQ